MAAYKSAAWPHDGFPPHQQIRSWNDNGIIDFVLQTTTSFGFPPVVTAGSEPRLQSDLQLSQQNRLASVALAGLVVAELLSGVMAGGRHVRQRRRSQTPPRRVTRLVYRFADTPAGRQAQPTQASGSGQPPPPQFVQYSTPQFAQHSAPQYAQHSARAPQNAYVPAGQQPRAPQTAYVPPGQQPRAPQNAYIPASHPSQYPNASGSSQRPLAPQYPAGGSRDPDLRTEEEIRLLKRDIRDYEEDDTRQNNALDDLLGKRRYDKGKADRIRKRIATNMESWLDADDELKRANAAAARAASAAPIYSPQRSNTFPQQFRPANVAYGGQDRLAAEAEQLRRAQTAARPASQRSSYSHSAGYPQTTDRLGEAARAQQYREMYDRHAQQHPHTTIPAWAAQNSSPGQPRNDGPPKPGTLPRRSYTEPQPTHTPRAPMPPPFQAAPRMSIVLTPERAKVVFQEYTAEWQRLLQPENLSDPNIPYPCPGLRASGLESPHTLSAPNVTTPVSQWSKETIMKANVMALFLGACGLVPSYVDRDDSRPDLGFNKAAASPSQLQQLKAILKAERLRWHSDKLGSRNGGSDGINASLRDDERARAVLHAVIELLKTI